MDFPGTGTHSPNFLFLMTLYWDVVSPMLHSPRGRFAIIVLLTTLLVFAPAYFPEGPLTFNVVP